MQKINRNSTWRQIFLCRSLFVVSEHMIKYFLTSYTKCKLMKFKYFPPPYQPNTRFTRCIQFNGRETNWQNKKNKSAVAQYSLRNKKIRFKNKSLSFTWIKWNWEEAVTYLRNEIEVSKMWRFKSELNRSPSFPSKPTTKKQYFQWFYGEPNVLV